MVRRHCPGPTQIRIGHSPLSALTGGKIFGPEPTSGQVTPAFISLMAETLLPNYIATLGQGDKKLEKTDHFCRLVNQSSTSIKQLQSMQQLLLRLLLPDLTYR